MLVVVHTCAHVQPSCACVPILLSISAVCSRIHAMHVYHTIHHQYILSILFHAFVMYYFPCIRDVLFSMHS